MSKGKTLLREIRPYGVNTNLDPGVKSPKARREEEIKNLSDLLIWIEISKDRTVKDIADEKTEEEMHAIIKKQLTSLETAHIAMSKVITKYAALLAKDKYLSFAFAEIYKNVQRLQGLEKLTSKGGRKRNEKIYRIAESECNRWFEKTRKKPSGKKLCLLVESAIDSAREDGNFHFSERAARNFLKQWQPPTTAINRQELVKSFTK